ncbi:MAG TPA: DUF11 domain-containing protein, partial [Ilumatobacteraceae bacterium]|nr:DUF11 domain-containing protein [Ilumatobacteraceae bacterium]
GINGADPVPGNNAASDTDTLDATPDLVVTKDDGAATRAAGDQFDYTIVVRNVGHQAATGVTVVDTLPDELTAVSCPATPVSCVIDADLGTVTWSVGDLNGGAALAIPAAASSITLTLTVVVDSTLASAITDFTNTVRADDDGANGIDPTPLDNEASDTDLLVAVPDLQIVKSDGVTAPVPGDELTYEIVVTNAGTQAATSVTVNDVLPPGVTFVSCTPVCDSSLLPTLTWTNLVEDAAGSPADPSAFDALGQATLVVTVSVDSPALAGVDDLDNVADVADDAVNGVDPTPGNNITHDVDLLDAAPDLTIAKSDGVPSVVGGQTVTYDIRFGNEGTQDATGVVITDVLPDGVTFVSCSDSCVSTGAPTIVWNVGDLDVGEVHTYQLTVDIDAPVAIPTRHFVNNVSIADDGTNGPDLDPSDNDGIDDDTTGIDLAVTKTDGVTAVVPGTAVSYIITVTNNGPTTIQSFTLRETLPASLLGVTLTPSVGSYDSTTQAWSGLGDFAEGESVTLTVSGIVNPAATGTLTNTVVVTPPVSAPDTDLANNTAVDVDDLTPTAVLLIDKQLTTDLERGQQAVYTIAVRNNGPSVATRVSVTDVLPDALTYVSGAGTGWTCSSLASIGAEDRPVCDLVAPLPVGESRSVELTVTVTGDFGTRIINEATVSSAISVASSSVLSDTAEADVAPAPAPPAAPPVPLPRTGASPLPMLRAAAFLIALGVLIVMGGRRRRIVR